MKRLLTAILWTLAALIALPLAYLVLVVAWNRFDEGLSPAAAALIEAQAETGRDSI
jgi:hypothetical protein